MKRQTKNIDLPFWGHRKQKITNHIFKLIDANSQTQTYDNITDEDTPNHSLTPLSTYTYDQEAQISSYDNPTSQKQNLTSVMNLPRQIADSPFNIASKQKYQQQKNTSKSNKTRPILKLLFENSKSTIKANEPDDNHKKSQIQCYNILEQYMGERSSVRMNKISTTRSKFEIEPGYSQSNEHINSEDSAEEQEESIPFYNEETYRPRQEESHVGMWNNSRQQYHAYQNQEQLKIATFQPKQLKNQLSKAFNNGQIYPDITYQRKKENCPLLQGQRPKLIQKYTNLLETSRPKTKYQQILDNYYKENKFQMVSKAKVKSIDKTASSKKNPKSQTSRSLASTGRLQVAKTLLNQENENFCLKVSNKSTHPISTQRRRAMSVDLNQRNVLNQGKQQNNKYLELLQKQNHNKLKQSLCKNTLKKTFDSTQKMKTQPDFPQNQIIILANQKSSRSSVKYQSNSWMKMTFNERQEKVLENKKSKIEQGQKMKEKQQLAGCTFKPKLTQFKQKYQPVKQKTRSYSKMYLQKIRNRGV